MVIQVYDSSTNAEEVVDKLYCQLQSEITKVCKQHMLLIVGHSNTKVGNDDKNVIGWSMI